MRDTRLESAPDGDEEDLFVPLEKTDPALSRELKQLYAERWLEESDLPTHRFEEAVASVELKVAPGDDVRLRRLRLTSYYTGTTYWCESWDGSVDIARQFIRESAVLQGETVHESRRRGPTPWDESSSSTRKRELPKRPKR